jgi:hypothetical protein
MKLSMIKIVLLLAVVVVLVSVSGGIFAQAQTGIDNGPAGSSAQDPNAAVAPAVVDANQDLAVPQAGLISLYKRFAGTAFYPRNSTYTYAENGTGGCIYNVANPFGIYVMPLNLPESSKVNVVRLYWYDTNASNSTLWLSRYDDHGGLVDIGSVSTSGNTGFGDNYFAPAYTVDNYTYSYLLNWRPIVSGSTMQLCGVRVMYLVQGPFWIPAVMKQP